MAMTIERQAEAAKPLVVVEGLKHVYGKGGGAGEALAIALSIGSVISFASMLMASRVGETAALRLHATELLMLLGTAIVMLTERPALAAPQIQRPASGLSLQQPQFLDNR